MQTSDQEKEISTWASISHPNPVERFFVMFRDHRDILVVLLSYTFLTGLLSLAVPLAAQSLVNTIAPGCSYNPW